MAVYTKKGRHLKAKAFREWCLGVTTTEDRDGIRNVGGEQSKSRIWFGFGMGNPAWDTMESSEVPLAPPTYSQQVLSCGDFFDSGSPVCSLVNGNLQDFSAFEGDLPIFPVYYPGSTYSESETSFLNHSGWNLDGYEPKGLLGFLRAYVSYVSPYREGMDDSLGTFLYGGSKWVYVEESSFPTNVFVSALIPFPGQSFISDYDIDIGLKVRQISVFRCPDRLVSNFEGQNLLRYDQSSIFEEVPSAPVSLVDPPHFYSGMLINDYVLTQPRVMNQVDRFGYLIGF